MADPATPTVPNADGVPPVQRTAATTTQPVTAASSDGDEITVTAATTVWGIHDQDGASIFADKAFGPTSWAETEDSEQSNIPDYPTESGGFQSYNKVERPGELRLMLTKEGTEGDRESFRRTLSALRRGVDMLNILTPSWTYRGYNLTEMSSARSAEKGAHLLTVRLTFREVRNSVELSFSNVQDASAASNVNGGAVQTQTPTASQTPEISPR